MGVALEVLLLEDDDRSISVSNHGLGFAGEVPGRREQILRWALGQAGFLPDRLQATCGGISSFIPEHSPLWGQHPLTVHAELAGLHAGPTDPVVSSDRGGGRNPMESWEKTESQKVT